MEGKRRRIRVHRGLTFALAIVLTVAIAVLVFQRSGFLSYQLSDYINEHYFKDTPFKFSCGEVKSDLVSRVSVADPVIRYQDEVHSVKVFSADEIGIEYSVVEALRLKVIVNYLELDKARISLWYDGEGKPILPVRNSLRGLGDGKVSPHVEVHRFGIYGLDFEVKRDDAPYSLKDVDLSGSVRYVDGEGRLRISQGRAGLTRNNGEISSLRADLEFGGGRVTVKDLVARFKESFVMISGRYEEGRLVDVQGVFNPLSLDELSALGWIGNEQGEVGGSVLVNGTRDSLAVEGSLAGRALGLVFSGLSLEGSVTPERVQLSSIDGQVHGCRLRGALGYERPTGSFSFDGVCEALDITEGFVPGRGAPETDFNGSIRVDHEAARNAYDFRARLRNSSIAGFEGEEIRLAGTWSDDAGLKLRSFDLARKGFAISGFGSIDTKDRAEFVLKLGGSDLDYAIDYFDLPRIGGAVDLAGKLTGPLDDLQLNANGTWRGLTYLDARIDSSVMLVDARGVRGPRVRATVDVDGQRLYVAGREFASPHVFFEVDGERVNVLDLSFSKGDTLVTMDFDVETGRAETPVRVRHVAVATPSGTWRSQKPATVTVSDGAAALDSLSLVCNGSRLWLSGSVSRASNTGDLRFGGEKIDLSVAPVQVGSALRVGGVADFNAAIRGDFNNPDVRLTLDALDGFVGDVIFDRISLEGEFAGGRYLVHRFCVVQGSDSLRADGWWEHGQSPVAAARAGFDKQAAWDAGIFVEAASRGFPVDRLVDRIGGGSGWSAALSGRWTLAHNLSKPRMDLSGVVRSKRGSRVMLPDIRVDLVYEEGRLAVESLSADDGKNRVTVRGVLPLGFDIERGFEFNPHADVDFEAEVDARDLSIVAGYLGPIAAATGNLAGRLDVRGPADDPRFEGDFKLRDAAFRLAGSDEIYRNVAADVAVRGKEVAFKSITARRDKRGAVEAEGTALLDGFGVAAYAFDATVTDLGFSTVPGFESVQSGKISVESHVDGEGRSVPFVTGVLDVKEALWTRPLATQDGPQSPLTIPTETPSWMCDLELHAPKNVWVRNPEVSLEMGGDLILKRDRTGLYLRGDLKVVRGSYTLYNNKFRITGGRFDFATATTLRPGVYLDAYTPYRRAGDVEHRIFLNLSWPADEEEPKITLSYSEAGYSEADIWAMLGGQVVTGAAFGDEGTWDAGETATSLASGYLERILNAQMSDMTVEVESSPAGHGGGAGDRESALTIAVGRYLSDDLYLNYRQGLRVMNTRQIDVEYRLSNMLLLRSEIIQHSQKGLQGKSRQATDEINFDLKFRWEY